jgi:hypothetical protein
MTFQVGRAGDSLQGAACVQASSFQRDLFFSLITHSCGGLRREETLSSTKYHSFKKEYEYGLYQELSPNRPGERENGIKGIKMLLLLDRQAVL